MRQRIDDMRTTKAEQLGRQPTDLEWCAAAAVPSMDELRRRRNNGRAAKERMICANMRLVVSCSKRYQNQGLALLDLWQEGNLGLIKVRARLAPRTAVEKLRIVTLAVSGGRSLTRPYATPADSPLQDCGLYSHVHVRRGSLGLVHRSRAVFCRPLPPQLTFSSLHSPTLGR